MGAYKSDVVAVIKMGAYIHGVLILCGCQVYGMLSSMTNYARRYSASLNA